MILFPILLEGALCAPFFFFFFVLFLFILFISFIFLVSLTDF